MMKSLWELLIYQFREIFPRRWPDDPAERRRMKAYILGAGSGGKAATKIEVENDKSKSDQV